MKALLPILLCVTASLSSVATANHADCTDVGYSTPGQQSSDHLALFCDDGTTMHTTTWYWRSDWTDCGDVMFLPSYGSPYGVDVLYCTGDHADASGVWVHTSECETGWNYYESYWNGAGCSNDSQLVGLYMLGGYGYLCNAHKVQVCPEQLLDVHSHLP